MNRFVNHDFRGKNCIIFCILILFKELIIVLHVAYYIMNTRIFKWDYFVFIMNYLIVMLIMSIGLVHVKIIIPRLNVFCYEGVRNPIMFDV